MGSDSLTRGLNFSLTRGQSEEDLDMPRTAGDSELRLELREDSSDPLVRLQAQRALAQLD